MARDEYLFTSESVTEGHPDKIAAGDQGLMFGYACTETPELMPLPIMLAHKLVMRLSETRRSGAMSFLRPDGKSQVSVRYADNKPVSVETVVISSQHSPDVDNAKLREQIIEQVIVPTIPAQLMQRD